MQRQMHAKTRNRHIARSPAEPTDPLTTDQPFVSLKSTQRRPKDNDNDNSLQLRLITSDEADQNKRIQWRMPKHAISSISNELSSLTPSRLALMNEQFRRPPIEST